VADIAPHDLWRRFHADVLPQDEVVTLIGMKFRGGQALSMNAVAYGPQGAHALLLRYRGTDLVAIEAGPGLTQELVDELEAETAAATCDNVVKICRIFLTARVPTESMYRYRDVFQILPVPADARRPFVISDPWPLVMEYAMRASSNHLLEATRSSRISQELTLLLNALLRYQIRGGPRRAGRKWVFVTHPGGHVAAPPILPELAIEGYSAPEYGRESETFRDLGAYPPMTIEPTSVHYSHFWIDADEQVCVPADFDRACNTFFSLHEVVRRAFLRAAFWLSHADRVREVSTSAAFAALVQAVECLMDEAPVDRCPTCERDRSPGPTARFIDFMKRHGSNLDKKTRATMYDIRSRISHGDKLLHSDFVPVSFSFSLEPGQMEEEGLWNTGRMATQTVLVNWLLDRGT
jgi:hypothetical protein